MSDDAFAFPNERRPGRGKQGQAFVGKPDGGPCHRVRELFVYARPQYRVGIDPCALTPNVGDHAFGRPPTSFRLDIAVVRGQEHREPVAE